jgi:hypothetical protein
LLLKTPQQQIQQAQGQEVAPSVAAAADDDDDDEPPRVQQQLRWLPGIQGSCLTLLLHLQQRRRCQQQQE